MIEIPGMFSPGLNYLQALKKFANVHYRNVARVKDLDIQTVRSYHHRVPQLSDGSGNGFVSCLNIKNGSVCQQM